MPKALGLQPLAADSIRGCLRRVAPAQSTLPATTLQRSTRLLVEGPEFSAWLTEILLELPWTIEAEKCQFNVLVDEFAE